jgi:putative redox protein
LTLAARGAEVHVRWLEGMRFDGGAPGRPAILVDGDSVAAASPVELLLLAAATCSAADVVSILEKQRVALKTVEVAMQGTRREEHPRRFTALRFTFTIAGAGLDEAKARRAIDLSLEKYCSVVASLAPDIPVTYDVTIR